MMSREMAAGKVLLVGCMAALALASAHGTRVEKVVGRQHPDTHVDGFVLKSVFLHDTNSNTVVRRMLRFDDNPHLLTEHEYAASGDRGLKQTPWPAISATENSKDRVIALAKLNLLAYDGDLNQETFYSEEVMSEIYDKKESLWGTDTATRAAEQAKMAEFRQLILDELDATVGQQHGYNYSPSSTQLAGTEVLGAGQGVAAFEFSRGGVSVVTFRGTATDGDYKNIYNWLHDWVLEKMTSRMKTIWTEEAKQEWTDELEDRNGEGTKTASGGICAFNLQEAGLGPEVADASGGVLTAEEAKATGYWEITKAITDEAFSETVAGANGTGLLLSGHSQGGTRAALASMYLRKSVKQIGGQDVQAVTFAATGPQCVARLMYSNADITDDVDPYIQHPQITEYVHVLDPWGQALGEENGNVCLYGVSDIQNHPAYQYCSEIWGHPGENLWFNEGADAISFLGWSLQDKPLLLAMKRCRYYTHFMEAMVLALRDGDVLNDDGTTKDGCKAATVAPKDDPDGVCPDPDHSACKDALAAWAIGLIVALVLVCCCCCGGCVYWRKRRKQAKALQDQSAPPPPRPNHPQSYGAAPNQQDEVQTATSVPVASVPVDGYQPSMYPKL